MSNQIMNIFDAYTNALSRGDFKAVFETMSDDIVWHMGGEGPLCGIIVGKQALKERLGEFAKRSNATFKIITNWAANNDCFVAEEKAQREQQEAIKKLEQVEMDRKAERDKIAEENKKKNQQVYGF